MARNRSEYPTVTEYYRAAGMRAFTVRLPIPMVATLDGLARRRGRAYTRSDVIQTAVEQYLARVKPLEEYDERVEEAS